MNEIEFKLLVADATALASVADEAARRGAHVRPAEQQVNHFFDTEAGELRAAGLVVRLREQSGAFVLAAKGRASAQGELHVRPEFETPVDAAAAGRLLDGSLNALEPLTAAYPREPFVARLAAVAAGRPLGRAGTFRNDRSKVGPLQVGAHELYLELDRTRFPGDQVHYEVELEVPAGLEDEARRWLVGLLDAAGVRGVPGPSKAARFYRSLAGETV